MSETSISGIYGNVGTPRFYMFNTLEHLISGVDIEIHRYGLEPIPKDIFYPETWSQNKKINIGWGAQTGSHLSVIVNFPSASYVRELNYMAVLGEQFFNNSGSTITSRETPDDEEQGDDSTSSTVTHNSRITVKTYDGQGGWAYPQNVTCVAGWGGESNQYFTPATHGGFGILRWDANNDALYNKIYFALTNEAGTDWSGWQDHIDFAGLMFGTYYEMPFSPDLSVKMGWEYDGTKTTTTKGGATLSNSMYHKPPDFGNEGYFVTYGSAGESQRSGRRTWDLSFSYISDTDLEPSTGTTYQTLRENNDFYSRVINRSWGQHIPFIFQPDKTKRDFALCRFDQDSFVRTQVAPHTYKMSLKIRESW